MYKTLSTVFGLFLAAGLLTLLNRGLYEMTKAIGEPTVIAGLGWTMHAPVIGSVFVQLALLVVGGIGSHWVASKLDPEDDASAQSYRR